MAVDPPPRDFTDPEEMRGIDAARMFQSVKYGRPGTAMKAFATILTDEEISRVVSYARYAFVEGKERNIRYHSAENGWAEFERKNREAIGFFLYEGNLRDLPEELERGKRIFATACVTCHLMRRQGGAAGDVAVEGEEDAVEWVPAR